MDREEVEYMVCKDTTFNTCCLRNENYPIGLRLTGKVSGGLLYMNAESRKITGNAYIPMEYLTLPPQIVIGGE